MSRLNLEAVAGAGANGAAAPVCGTCKHWFELPANPNQLGLHLGECRHGPIAVTIYPDGNKATGYPVPRAETPACGQYGAKVAVGT